MAKIAFLAALAAVVPLVAGCGTGATTESDLDAERNAIEKQTPSNVEPVKPPDDTVSMGAGKGG